MIQPPSLGLELEIGEACRLAVALWIEEAGFSTCGAGADDLIQNLLQLASEDTAGGAFLLDDAVDLPPVSGEPACAGVVWPRPTRMRE